MHRIYSTLSLGLCLATLPVVTPRLAAQDAAATTTTSNAGNIRVVPCGTKVPSSKRGVCANKMSDEDFRALAPAVSWYYNWHYTTNFTPPKDVTMEFIPQAWGNRPADLQGLEKYLQDAPVKPHVVLAINEPNLKDQAFITPKQTAELYAKIKTISDRYNIPTVGPNMALGSPTDGSIRTMDPIENKEVTYTFMIPFLNAFFHFLGEPSQVAGIGMHSYGNIGELKWAVEELYKTYQRPVWVTEYAQWKTGSVKEACDYVIASTDFLENNPHVAGYAWFKERADNSSITLLEKAPGKLSPIGEAYISVPSHEANVYYRLPGRIEAESYVTVHDASLRTTADSDGVFEMVPGSESASMDYNIMVDKAGDYTVSFRIFMGHSTTTPIELLKGTDVIASAKPEKHEWTTVQSTVKLEAGPQTLRLHSGGYLVNWIEFAN